MEVQNISVNTFLVAITNLQSAKRITNMVIDHEEIRKKCKLPKTIFYSSLIKRITKFRLEDDSNLDSFL